MMYRKYHAAKAFLGSWLKCQLSATLSPPFAPTTRSGRQQQGLGSELNPKKGQGVKNKDPTP